MTDEVDDRRAIEAFPPGAVWEFYGSTEGQFTACSTDDWLTRPGSVGQARPDLLPVQPHRAFDGIAPLANSEAIVERIPNAALSIYDGGHAFFAQDGRALGDVLDFLTA